jgi:hypothetical protein
MPQEDSQAMPEYNRDGGVRFKRVKIPVSTKVGTGVDEEGNPVRKETVIEAEVPASLEDALKAEGPKVVWKRYLQSLGIEIQGDHRRALQEKKAGERKRAAWTEELGV